MLAIAPSRAPRGPQGRPLIPLRARTHAGRGRPHWYGRAIRLTTIFDEHQLTFRDMARRTNKGVMLNATKTVVSSGTTLVRINSEPHAVQFIASTPTAATCRSPFPILAVGTLATLCREEQSIHPGCPHRRGPNRAHCAQGGTRAQCNTACPGHYRRSMDFQSAARSFGTASGRRHQTELPLTVP